ncbi:MAG: DUF2804 domain-containing protein [Myxococcota bacterium]|jgi:hypothetical protein|nr:DUF2804 domain-containing protein [Myxococcota bacterium]
MRPSHTPNTWPLGRYDQGFEEYSKLPSGLYAKLRAKAWQHVAIVCPSHFLGLAWVDLGYFKTAWCYVFDRETKQAFEYKEGSPLLDLEVNLQLGDGHCVAMAPGLWMRVHNHLEARQHRLQLAIGERARIRSRGTDASRRPTVTADLRCRSDEVQALVAVLPAGRRGGMCSYKVALPSSGRLELSAPTTEPGGSSPRELVLDAEHCTALFDIHRAVYPYQTRWNWATAAGRSPSGQRLAFNLTTNSSNPAEAEYNENAFWLDGKRFDLDAARFERQAKGWRMNTLDGKLELSFVAEGARRQNQDLLLLRSRFEQSHGHFTGTFRGPDGPVAVEGLYGMLEDHASRW